VMSADELYSSIKAEAARNQEAEADAVTEAEIAEQRELNRLFGLPEGTPEAAAEQVRRQRARLEEVKAANPIAWAEAEARAADSREWARLRSEQAKRGGIGGNQA